MNHHFLSLTTRELLPKQEASDVVEEQSSVDVASVALHNEEDEELFNESARAEVVNKAATSIMTTEEDVAAGVVVLAGRTTISHSEIVTRRSTFVRTGL